MKVFPIIIILLLIAGQSFCQQEPGIFNERRSAISNTGLKVLGGYAIANIITGSVGAAGATGSNKYFHQMNAIWNGVTLGVIAIGHLAQKKEGTLTLLQSQKKQRSIEKLFLFNAGLDVAYIAGGAYLRERSKNATVKPERLKGYGESVMLQGAVLLLFDGVMYIIHHNHGKKLDELAAKVQIGISTNGIGAVVRF